MKVYAPEKPTCMPMRELLSIILALHKAFTKRLNGGSSLQSMLTQIQDCTVRALSLIPTIA